MKLPSLERLREMTFCEAKRRAPRKRRGKVASSVDIKYKFLIFTGDGYGRQD